MLTCTFAVLRAKYFPRCFCRFLRCFFHARVPGFAVNSRTMTQPGSTVSSPTAVSTSAPTIRTSAPQVFCVASYATLPSLSTTSSAGLSSASSQPAFQRPTPVNLQTYLQPMIAAAVQQALRDLPPASLSPVSSAPGSLAPGSLAASTHSSAQSAAPPVTSSFLGVSVYFPSFVPTVCVATVTPFASPGLLADSLAGSTTPTPSVVAPVLSVARLLASLRTEFGVAVAVHRAHPRCTAGF